MQDRRPSRERLLDAAERLVALRGLAVSNREIALAAAHRNNSAIAYHFGSRQGLLDAVWERRSAAVNERRARMIDELDDDQRRDVRQLARIHVVPLTDEVAARLPSYWARFNQQWLSAMPTDFLSTFADDLAARPGDVPLRTLQHVFAMVASALVDLPPHARELRVSLMTRFVITALASWEHDVELAVRPQASMPAFAADLTEMAVAILLAPWQHPKQRSGVAAGAPERDSRPD